MEPLLNLKFIVVFKASDSCNDIIYILAQLRIVRKTKPVDILYPV